MFAQTNRGILWLGWRWRRQQQQATANLLQVTEVQKIAEKSNLSSAFSDSSSTSDSSWSLSAFFDQDPGGAKKEKTRAITGARHVSYSSGEKRNHHRYVSWAGEFQNSLLSFFIYYNQIPAIDSEKKPIEAELLLVL